MKHSDLRPQSLSGWVSFGLVVGIVALAFCGPYIAPHSPTMIAGPPLSPPSTTALLGTDVIGRDVLSRVLWGGRSLIVLAAMATVLGFGAALIVGMVAGYSRSRIDPVFMRTCDVLLAFPPLLFLLVLATGLGAGAVVIVIGVAIILLPSNARVIRSATLDVSFRGYVEAGVVRGEPTRSILRREILPNISPVVVAAAGPAFTYAILLAASLSFLGLGLQPPTADWALMIAENRLAISVQPWPILVPALLIATLGVGVNLYAQDLARHSKGRSIERSEG